MNENQNNNENLSLDNTKSKDFEIKDKNNNEEKMPDKEIFSIWKSFPIENSDIFQRIPDNLIENITKNTKNISLIIPNLFEKLLKKCLDNFDFISNEISFDEYLEFYKAINISKIKLEKKIIHDDAKNIAYFVGDTHGAIHESYILIDFFYNLIQKKPNTKIIFIGDYVDRNPYDLENLTLITAFHILFPNNVVLLRGNHEDRLINQHYGFMDNLLRSFFDKGELLYKEIIKFFTRLPIAHICQIYSEEGGSARVLSVHGGIPVDERNFLDPVILENIEEQLICEVEESKDMDPLTTSMLWSDPNEMIQGISTGDHLQGRIQFGLNVFNVFMNANKLDLVVRGHQKWSEGYKIFFNGRLYSIFSTATYDGKIKFSPKILKLEYGKTPSLIPINSENLFEELEN